MSLQNINPKDLDGIAADYGSANGSIASRVELVLMSTQHRAYELGVARMRENALALIEQVKASNPGASLEVLTLALLAAPIDVPANFIDEFMARES